MGMSLHRLSRLLDSFGADPAAWPAAEREPARTLLDASPEARALRARAARLDAALDSSLAPPDPAALARMRAHVAARIARTPLPAPAPAPSFPGSSLLGRWLRPALPAGCGALAVLAVCGVWLVLATPRATWDLAVAPPVLAMLEDGD